MAGAGPSSLAPSRDAEVVDLSKRFVCVKLDTDRDAKLADEFRIDTIPRSILLMPDGTIARPAGGLLPATDYAAWLKAGLARPARRRPRTRRADSIPPPPAGFSEAQADLIVWFVDNDRVAEGWREPDAFRHPVLLPLLGAAGFKPRVEHLSRADFPTRWKQAEALHRLPDLIAATNWAGMIRDLDKAGRFRTIHLRSSDVHDRERLVPGLLSRGSSARPGLCSRVERPQGDVESMLAPGPEVELPGPALPEAVRARRGRGDRPPRRGGVSLRRPRRTQGRSPLAARPSSRSAPGPGPGTRAERCRRDRSRSGGTTSLAVAVVEASFENDLSLGADRGGGRPGSRGWPVEGPGGQQGSP